MACSVKPPLPEPALFASAAASVVVADASAAEEEEAEGEGVAEELGTTELVPMATIWPLLLLISV